MHAAVVSAHGGFECVEWKSVPRPVVRAGEVLVQVRAAAMNHLDLWVRRGVPGHKFPLPMILGSDGGGVVVECGAGAESVALGSEVLLSPGVSCGKCEACLLGSDNLCREYRILGEARDGCCAEFVCVPTANLIPKPPGMPFEECVGFTLPALTAWTMLVRKARIQPGQQVLVLAGTSGVGALGIQIAKHHGCRVIATAGGAAKCERLREFGADETIDHDREDVADRVRMLTERRGVDVVFEHVGKATWSASLKSLARGGTLVTCGATTGANVESDLRLIFFKNLSILGSTMGSKGDALRVARLLAEGKLRCPVGAVLPMREIQEAHRRLESRRIVGKVVLLP